MVRFGRRSTSAGVPRPSRPYFTSSEVGWLQSPSPALVTAWGVLRSPARSRRHRVRRQVRGELWPFYRAWRDGVAADPDGEKSFQRTTGMTLAEADAVRLKWVTGKK